MVALLINLTDIHPAIFDYSIRLFGNVLHIPCSKLNAKQLYFWLYFTNNKNSYLFITIAAVSSYDNYTFRSANVCSILFFMKIF